MRYRLKRAIFAITLPVAFLPLLAGLLAAVSSSASSDVYQVWLPLQLRAQPSIQLEPFTIGLPSVTTITHAGDNRLFASIRDGRIYIMAPDGTLQTQPFLDIRDRVETGFWEQGLLGLAFHPDYPTNGTFYIYYTAKTNTATIAPGVLARYTVDPAGSGPVDPATEQVLLTIPHEEHYHYGGALEFGPDGFLYLASGDGTYDKKPPGTANAQNGDNLLGKILRLDVDTADGAPYAIPLDNPFVGDDSISDEIWLLGLRNPWRFSFDRLTGDLLIGDVGLSRREEVNRVRPGEAGLNFGWPCFEGHEGGPEPVGCGPRDQYTFPIHAYNHAEDRCAITGGFVYRGSAEPDLFGRYLFADFCAGTIWALLDVAPGGTAAGASVAEVGRFPGHLWSTFGEDINGELYLGEFLGSVTVFRIRSAD